MRVTFLDRELTARRKGWAAAKSRKARARKQKNDFCHGKNHFSLPATVRAAHAWVSSHNKDTAVMVLTIS